MPLKHCPASSQQASSVAAPARVRARSGGTDVELPEYRYQLDSAGRQHFNFRQCVWLQPQIAMAVTPVMTIALETLAANLLSLALRADGHHPEGRSGSRERLGTRLARRFCEQCLLTADADGWVMPRASIRAWIAAQRRRGLPL